MERAVGFTLVEVLAVVAIAGIVLAVAAVNLFPGDAEVARREASRIALAVEKARDAAWFGGRPTAIGFADGRLKSWRLAASGEWAPDARSESPLGEARIMGLFVDGEPLDPASRLVFLADGFGTPYRIALDIRGHALAVEGDPAGVVTVRSR